MKYFLIQSLNKVGLKSFSNKINNYLSNFFFSQIFLKLSLFFFRKSYTKYWSKIKSNESLTNLKEQYNDLKQNGFSKIDNYFSKKELSQISKDVKKLKGFTNGKYKGTFYYKNFPKDGICSLGIDPSLENCFNIFTKNTKFLSLAKALYGNDMRLTSSSVLCKYGKDKIDSSNVPHWDDWRVRLKIFLLLEDVTMKNAPMIYFKASHKKEIPWRFEKDFSSVFLSYEASAGGSWWPIENLNLQKVYFTGKKGTCYIFDATGVHSGTQLISGKRLMLMNMYTNHLDYTFRSY